MPISAGARLGPYEILAPIGAGGMGGLYKARDTRLDRIVAIKVSKEQFSQRFEREARAVAALNHPHICTLHDVGPDYLVMEYIEGQPLKGPLPLADALRFAAQIAEALDAAHKKGITHRDLKPANIIVTKQGIKLLDFGLAHRAPGENDPPTLTAVGTVIGTPAYMAPEQWEGKAADARSDIYSLGCVLYEMLTGKRAARGRKPVEPAALESVLAGCLEMDPDDRWQSARDVRRALALPPSSATKPVRRWSWIAMASAAVAVVVGALLFLALLRGRAPASGDVVSFAIYPPEMTAFSTALNTTVSVPQFALSPDGRAILFVAGSLGGRPTLWVRSLEQVSARALPGTEDALHPFWSPDSRWIGFFAEGKLKKIPAAGGAVQVVTQKITDFRGGTWGPDDSVVFATGSEPLQRVSSAGGAAIPVSIVAPVEGSHRYPQLLPDGRHFLYANIGSTDQSGVYAGSLDDKTGKRLLRTPRAPSMRLRGICCSWTGTRCSGRRLTQSVWK